MPPNESDRASLAVKDSVPSLPSQWIRTAIVGACLGVCVGYLSFDLVIGALTQSVNRPIVSYRMNDVASAQSSYLLVSGMAGILVALAGLLWSRSPRLVDRLAIWFVMAALYLSVFRIVVRIVRPGPIRPTPPPLPAGTSLAEIMVSVDQIPILWPPAIGCVVICVMLIAGWYRTKHKSRPAVRHVGNR